MADEHFTRIQCDWKSFGKAIIRLFKGKYKAEC